MSLAAITEIKLGDEIYETAEEKAEHSPVAPTRIHYTPEQWVRRAEHTHRGPDGRRSFPLVFQQCSPRKNAPLLSLTLANFNRAHRLCGTRNIRSFSTIS